MPQPLFPHFLVDPVEYDMAIQYWQTICAQVLDSLGVRKNWIVFMQGERDGNPIFAMINGAQKRMFRIIQLDPTISQKDEVVAWVDKFAEGDPEEVDELVYTCTLSDEAARIFALLLADWAGAALNRTEMERRIEVLLKS